MCFCNLKMTSLSENPVVKMRMGYNTYMLCSSYEPKLNWDVPDHIFSNNLAKHYCTKITFTPFQSSKIFFICYTLYIYYTAIRSKLYQNLYCYTFTAIRSYYTAIRSKLKALSDAFSAQNRLTVFLDERLF